MVTRIYQDESEQNVVPVSNQMTFRVEPSIGRVQPCCAACSHRSDALSRTLAFCQSRRRRQHVIPLHITNRISVIATRSGLVGLGGGRNLHRIMSILKPIAPRRPTMCCWRVGQGHPPAAFPIRSSRLILSHPPAAASPPTTDRLRLPASHRSMVPAPLPTYSVITSTPGLPFAWLPTRHDTTAPRPIRPGGSATPFPVNLTITPWLPDRSPYPHDRPKMNP